MATTTTPKARKAPRPYCTACGQPTNVTDAGGQGPADFVSECCTAPTTKRKPAAPKATPATPAPAALRVGQWVTVEVTTGKGARAKTKTVTGKVTRDDEGTLRVEDVPLTRDAEGYLPAGVVLVSTGKPAAPKAPKAPGRPATNGERGCSPTRLVRQAQRYVDPTAYVVLTTDGDDKVATLLRGEGAETGIVGRGPKARAAYQDALVQVQARREAVLAAEAAAEAAE